MPGIDGPELQRRLNAEGLGVPIIFVTADGTLRRRLIEAGAIDLLHKPFAANSLLAALETAVGRHELASYGDLGAM